MLLGEHQKINSACAIATLKILRNKGWKISDRAIAPGHVSSKVAWQTAALPSGKDIPSL